MAPGEPPCSNELPDRSVLNQGSVFVQLDGFEERSRREGEGLATGGQFLDGHERQAWRECRRQRSTNRGTPKPSELIPVRQHRGSCQGKPAYRKSAVIVGCRRRVRMHNHNFRSREASQLTMPNTVVPQPSMSRSTVVGGRC